MAGYGTGPSNASVIAYITRDETSASESDSGGPTKPKIKASASPRAYRLWSHEVNEEGETIHGAIESLGERFTSGKISRFEFENRTALIEHFSKYTPPSDLPFGTIVEEGPVEGEEDYSLAARVRRACWYSMARATHAMCFVCFVCCDDLYRRL